MIANLKPYSSMRDPRVPWLGEVPKHWEVRRLRNLADMRVSNVDKHTKEGEQPVRLCNYVDVYKHDYIRPSMGLMRATATRDEVDQFRLAVGDVLITKDSEAWNDIGVPALVQETAPDLVSGYHLALLRPFEQRLSGEYLLRVLQSTATQYQFHVEANGVTRYGLSHAAIKSVWLPAPPLPEQAAIVRFLDHADRRIRRYIRAKQKLIKLLEEQKQAIIHRAVTRGLDPNVRLKPSGVEWLGDVPEQWEVKKLKHLTRFRNGLAFKPADWSSEGVPIIRIQNLNGSDQFNYTTRNDLPADLLIRTGDLLFSWSGNRGTSFGSYMWDRDFSGYLNQHIFKLEGYSLHKRYFAHLLRAVTTHIEEQTHGIIGLVHVTKPELGAVLVPVAPPNEQQQIADEIDSKIASLDAIAARARREIDLLREHRTRLIADVVTGKLDVREAAARLSDEVEEPEPIDENETEADGAGADDTDEVPEEVEA